MTATPATTTRIRVGHVLNELRKLPPKSIHMVVTSPPYWGLRAYGTDPQVWGGTPDCQHEWTDASWRNSRGNDDTAGPKQRSNIGAVGHRVEHKADTCRLCGAWRGELGSEPTPQLFIAHLVEVFAEIWRVLREDGTCWVNLGDSYASNWGMGAKRKSSWWSTASGELEGKGWGDVETAIPPNSFKPGRADGIKVKDLCGMPWRFAFAMQDAGWYLRRDIIWSKRSPMPESVNDRPTTAHEYIFLFSKQPRYFYDGFAIRESATMRPSGNKHKSWGDNETNVRSAATGAVERCSNIPHGGSTHRNARSVWTFSNHPVKEAHFATFPPALPERCIRAGTSEHGCCPECGTPWRRVTKKVRKATRPGVDSKVYEALPVHPDIPINSHNGTICGNRDPQRHVTETAHVGWYPGCRCVKAPPLPHLPKKPREQEDLETWIGACDPVHGEREAICRDLACLPVVPAVVLEPFLGSGTTGLMADYLGRDWIGLELNPKYAEIAKKRTAEGYSPPKSMKPKPRRRVGQKELFA